MAYGRYNPTTKHGYSMYTMSSMLQKAIRRGDLNHAGYAANELFGGYNAYLWKRLLTISAEDCYGIMTKEIIALKQAEDIVCGNKKGYDRDQLFVAKAITLLCLARKNRDGCYVACNFMIPDRTLRPDEIPDEKTVDISECHLGVDGIPDWVFDIHTREGRAAGKTDLDMTISEQEALEPKQLSLFDNASWGTYYDSEIRKGNIRWKEQQEVKKFQQGKENDPTHGGEVWPNHPVNFG